MGKTPIDITAILAPIPGENPAGEDLRYADVYERIKEARRADDTLSQGDWQREVKTSDWAEVSKVASEALGTRTKDLQIAVWLTEALIRREGFAGLHAGLTILGAFLSDFWETLYPLVEDGDLEYRSGPLEFLNDKVAFSILDIPVTDPRTGEGFSWTRWQESRQVGYEKDTKNQWGDVDEGKLRTRQEQITEGKITAEAFDAAFAKSPKDFYVRLADEVNACTEAFTRLDAVVDEKFGRDAPRLSELRKAIEDTGRLAGTLLKEKGGPEVTPQPKPEPEKPEKGRVAGGAQEEQMARVPVHAAPVESKEAVAPVIQYADQGAFEDAVWRSSQDTLASSGIKPALENLLAASSSAPSIRQKNRFRLMMVKLALMAERPDIARPIVEELYNLIGELGLERWESPLWVAEVIEAYYLCLTADGATDDDRYKANSELFPKLCSKDITKALAYKKGG